jgi:F-type H+-transporting ATPase subunit a
MFLFIFILPSFFFIKINVGYIINVITSFFTSEIIYVMTNVNKKKGVVVMFLSVFILIFILNFTALLPYLFSSTSHLTITIPLAYSI